jgi:tetratricopeptide (TPR) repeat protein
MKKYLLVSFIFFVLAANCNAQEIIPYYSPKASVSQTIGFTEISIDYCRPGVKDRKIWGSLVQYNKIWRTGANESTRIKFTTDVYINGNKVPAGIYSVYTIPNENEWTVILNKALVWGTEYVQEKDLLRFNVKPKSGIFTERLQFTIPELTDSTCNVVMNWEKLELSFGIKIDFAKQVYSRIKEAISKAGPDDFSVYVVGARFAADYGVFLNEASEWIDKAISISKNFTCFFQKARLYYASGKYIDALKEIERCRDAGRNDSDYLSHIAEIDFLEMKIKDKL